MDEARRRRPTSKFRRWSRLMPRTSNREEGYFCRSLDKVEGSFVRISPIYARCLSHREGFSSFVFFFFAPKYSHSLLVASRPRRISSFPFLLFPRGQTANLSSPPSSFSCEGGEPPFCSVRRSTMFECVSRTFISFYLFSLLFLFPSPSALPPIPAAAAKANANNVFFFSSLC